MRERSTPSYNQGFAPRDGSSAYERLWAGLEFAYAPGLGCTGDWVPDWGYTKSKAVVNGGVDWNAGGYRFNGASTDWMDTATHQLAENASQQPMIAVSFWVKPLVSDGTLDAVFRLTGTNFGCFIQSSTFQILTSAWLDTGVTPVIDRWYHLFYWQNKFGVANEAKIWVNGIKKFDGAGHMLLPTTGVVRLGGDAFGQMLTGYVDDFRYYREDPGTWMYHNNGEMARTLYQAGRLGSYRLKRSPRVLVAAGGGPLTLTPSSVAVALSIPAPVISFGALAVTPSPVAVALSAPVPSLSFGALALTPSPSAVALSIPAPVISFGALALTPSPITLSFTVPAPSVSFGALTLTPSSATLSLSIPAPSVSFGAIALAPSSVGVALTVPAPAVSLGTLALTPSPLAVNLTIPSPVVTVGGALNLTPIPVAVALATPDPALAFGTLALEVDPVSVALAAPAPSVSLGTLALAPSSVVMSLLIPSPAATFGALSLLVDPVAFNILVPVPNLDTGVALGDVARRTGETLTQPGTSGATFTTAEVGSEVFTV